MYVCLCNGYREAELRKLALDGVGCALEAYDTLGGGPSCGECLDCAQRIIDQIRSGHALTVGGGGD